MDFKPNYMQTVNMCTQYHTFLLNISPSPPYVICPQLSGSLTHFLQFITNLFFDLFLPRIFAVTKVSYMNTLPICRTGCPLPLVFYPFYMCPMNLIWTVRPAVVSTKFQRKDMNVAALMWMLNYVPLWSTCIIYIMNCNWIWLNSKQTQMPKKKIQMKKVDQ